MSAAAGRRPIPYEAVPAGTAAQRRLLARTRTYLPERRSLRACRSARSTRSPSSTRPTRCASRPGLLSGIFGSKLSAAELDRAPQLTTARSSTSTATATCGPPRRGSSTPPILRTPRPGYAQAHFYLPQGAVDPWGNVSTLGYDDAQPAPRRDHGRTRQHDVGAEQLPRARPVAGHRPEPQPQRRPLRRAGMIVATAAMGKLQADGSDEGDHLDTSTAEPSAGDDPTARLAYDLSAYATWAADPDARRRPSAPRLGSNADARASQGPDYPVARVIRLQRRARSGRAHQGAGRARRCARARSGRQPSSATRRVRSCSRRPQPAGSGADGSSTTTRATRSSHTSRSSTRAPYYDDETDLVEWGVTSITRYDPLGRPIRVDNPNGTLRNRASSTPGTPSAPTRTTRSSNSAWYAARSGGQLGAGETDAAVKAATHANTPATTDLDTLGRTFRTVADNGSGGQYATVLDARFQRPAAQHHRRARPRRPHPGLRHGRRGDPPG